MKLFVAMGLLMLELANAQNIYVTAPPKISPYRFTEIEQSTGPRLEPGDLAILARVGDFNFISFSLCIVDKITTPHYPISRTLGDITTKKCNPIFNTTWSLSQILDKTKESIQEQADLTNEQINHLIALFKEGPKNADQLQRNIELNQNKVQVLEVILTMYQNIYTLPDNEAFMMAYKPSEEEYKITETFTTKPGFRGYRLSIQSLGQFDLLKQALGTPYAD